jgi:hypothetical protein
MHARVSTYSGEAEGLLDGFQAATAPLEEIEGFSKAYFLVDRANDKARTPSGPAPLEPMSCAKARWRRPGPRSSRSSTTRSRSLRAGRRPPSADGPAAAC